MRPLLRRQGGRATLASAEEAPHASSLVLFLSPRLASADRRALDDLLGRLTGKKLDTVCVVSSSRIHLGDRNAAATEAFALDRVKALGVRTVVVRAGHVLSPHSRTTSRLRQLGGFGALVPERLRSCFVSGDELFAAIESERRGEGRQKVKVVTLLGANESWRSQLKQHRQDGSAQFCLRIVCGLLALLMVGHLAGLVLDVLARRSPGLRHWNFDTLLPASLGELLSSTTVQFRSTSRWSATTTASITSAIGIPGKTVVSTVHCNRIVRTGSDRVKADCGTTIRKALDFLAASGQELPVVPNYSYVCLGTAFFVPIHGSAADFSTVADTITKVRALRPRSRPPDRVPRTRRPGLPRARLQPAIAAPWCCGCTFARQAEGALLHPQGRDRERQQRRTLAALRDTRRDERGDSQAASAASGQVQIIRFYHESRPQDAVSGAGTAARFAGPAVGPAGREPASRRF